VQIEAMDTTTLLSALKLVGTPLCLEAAKEIERLTAAAQVGEPMKEIKQYEAMTVRNAVSDTIERCAQVVENYYHEGAIPFGLRAEIAAAIRKMKGWKG